MCMRYSPGHKEATRERLLDLSSALSKEHGFDSMSVDTLMSAAGLTGGAFYAHFKSKDALFVELIRRELERSGAMLSPRDGHAPDEWLSKTLDAYLSMAHIRHPESGCVLPSLGAEIARAEPAVKKIYEKAMLDLQQRWAEGLGDGDLAWAVLCQIVGTIVVARAMSSRRAMQEVVDANRARLEQVRAAPAARPKKPAARGTKNTAARSV
jgi:TetR/AcrR family transcriptional regulator, transcriptional repressor for nem operon